MFCISPSWNSTSRSSFAHVIHTHTHTHARGYFSKNWTRTRRDIFPPGRQKAPLVSMTFARHPHRGVLRNAIPRLFSTEKERERERKFTAQKKKNKAEKQGEEEIDPVSFQWHRPWSMCNIIGASLSAASPPPLPPPPPTVLFHLREFRFFRWLLFFCFFPFFFRFLQDLRANRKQ